MSEEYLDAVKSEGGDARRRGVPIDECPESGHAAMVWRRAWLRQDEQIQRRMRRDGEA